MTDRIDPYKLLDDFLREHNAPLVYRTALMLMRNRSGVFMMTWPSRNARFIDFVESLQRQFPNADGLKSIQIVRHSDPHEIQGLKADYMIIDDFGPDGIPTAEIINISDYLKGKPK